MKKYILISILSTLMATSVWGVPARRSTFKHTQPDGKELSLSLVGDEFMHYYLNESDGTKMLQGKDGHFYPMAEETLQAMQQRADVRREATAQRRAERLQRMHNSANGPAKVGTFGNMTGTKKGIVILVNFADKSLTTGTQAVFNNMFNEEGYSQNGHIGSVADYFKAQSYGLFNLSFDVVGPVTLSNNMEYYGGNDNNGSDQRPAQMAKEACQKANALGVDFSQYDWNGNGYVDQVFVIYAGYGENYQDSDPNTIWPHEWSFTSAGVGTYSIDGVKIDTYACTSELSGTSGETLCGIGTACHEFSHCLGYPDTYDTDYSGGLGMGSYDVMCSGSYNGPNYNGEVPAGYTAYERWMAGWLTPTELNAPMDIENMADLGSSPTAYIIYNSSHTDEYFLIENRQATNWFKYYETVTAGHGLFITHIDYNATVWSNNEPNDDPEHQRIAWVPADKDYTAQTAAQLRADFFPGANNVTSFTADESRSTTGGKWFNQENGSDYSPHTLTEITETNGKVSFKVDGGDNGIRYTITYNAGAGSCSTTSWTQTTSSVQATTLPSCTIESEVWSFAGWNTAEVAETTTQPTLLKAGSNYTPSANITLYAVYKKTEGGTTSGSYTLDYDAEGLSSNKNWGSYGKAYSHTAKDGAVWVIKAYKNQGMQINKEKDASIKVPACAGAISSIVVTDTKAKVLKFSATDYTGSNSPTAAATSASSTTATLDLSGKDMTTGYIYTTDGATVITKIVVNYAGTGTSYYATNPTLQQATAHTLTLAAHKGDDYYATFSSNEVTFFPETDENMSFLTYVKKATVANGRLTLTALTLTENATVGNASISGYYVPANTGVLLAASFDKENKEITYYTVTGQTVEALSGNMLYAGTGAVTAAPDNAHTYSFFRLAYGNYTAQTGLGFYYGYNCPNGEAFTCKAGSAYLAVPAEALAQNAATQNGFVLGEEETEGSATGIDAFGTLSGETHIVDMNGREMNASSLEQLPHGLYIVNGRRVMK